MAVDKSLFSSVRYNSTIERIALDNTVTQLTTNYRQGGGKNIPIRMPFRETGLFPKDTAAKWKAAQRSITNFSILGFSLIMLLWTMALYHQAESALTDADLYRRHDGLLGPVCLIQPFQQPESDLASVTGSLYPGGTPMVEEIPVKIGGREAGICRGRQRM